MRTPEDGVAEILHAKETGFKGVMMPGDPAVDDHNSAVYDKVWAGAVGGETPLPFHILTGKSDGLPGQARGLRINGFLSIIRGCQDCWVAFRMKDVQCPSTDVGERFPAFRFNLPLVADHARRAHQGLGRAGTELDLPRQRGGTIQERLLITT
ncbi:hypothetical protein [Phenylobacterium sp.]|uniref:hypothetical protein n=1 Tax=Phenylobacterium sp. TaxID=1871053 RepID=UPI002619BDE6|nr:hypothetical protein [Phenylobacterium sp.]